jgi:hypothetical protein
MQKKPNAFLDILSEFISHRKGLLPIIGMILIVINYIIQFFPTLGWLVTSNLLLHFGIVTAILGFLIAWAL